MIVIPDQGKIWNWNWGGKWFRISKSQKSIDESSTKKHFPRKKKFDGHRGIALNTPPLPFVGAFL